MLLHTSLPSMDRIYRAFETTTKKLNCIDHIFLVYLELHINAIKNILTKECNSQGSVFLFSSKRAACMHDHPSLVTSLLAIAVNADSKVGVGDGASNGDVTVTFEATLTGAVVVGTIKSLWSEGRQSCLSPSVS